MFSRISHLTLNQSLRKQCPSKRSLAASLVLSLISNEAWHSKYRRPLQPPSLSLSVIALNSVMITKLTRLPLHISMGLALAIFYLFKTLFSASLHLAGPHIQKKRLYINAKVANVYVKPEANSPLETQAKYGDTFEYLGKSGDYIEVEFPGQNRGFILAKQIGISYLPPTIQNLSKVFIENPVADFYHTPKIQAKIGTLVFGTEMHLASSVDDLLQKEWVEVILPNGKKVWMNALDLALLRNLSLEEMLQLAPRFIGVHYAWGEDTGEGLDCSGLIKMLFRRMGIALPHSANKISKLDIFKKVEGSLQRGDLIVFRPDNSSSLNFTHIGIMLNEREFLHSTVADRKFGIRGGVQISSLSDEKWKTFYSEGRRLQQEYAQN